MALWSMSERGSFWLAFGWLLFLCACLLRGCRRDKKREPVFLLCILLLFGTGIGFLRMNGEKRTFEQEEAGIEAFAGEKILVRGRLSSIKKSKNGWRVELAGVMAGADGKNVRLRCMQGYLDETAGLGIGMTVCVRGEVRAAGPARNPGGFDYRLYCRSQGVGGIIYGESYEILGKDGIRPFPERMRRLGELLDQKLSNVAEPADAGILKAVLLGNKTELSDSVYALYQRNGISHLLAISGLHVSMIGMSLWKTLRKSGAGYGPAGLMAGALLVAYGQLVGFGPSVTRAVCMLLLSFAAGICGRSYDLPSALCVPALLLLLIRPYLLTQAGFQLSFLAVMGVLCPGRLLLLLGKGKSSWTPLWEAFGVSLSVQLVTAPVLLYHSFEFPLYAVLLNLPVVALMPLAAVSGFLGLFAAFLWEPAGKMLLGGAHYILKLYELLCRGVEALPFSVLCPGRPGAWQIVSYYVLLLVGTAVLWRHELRLDGQKKRREAGKAGTMPCSVSCRALVQSALFWGAAALCLMRLPSGGLSVTFLDVGQGDGIFLEAAGQAVLVDCGSSQEGKVGEDFLIPFLKSRGVQRLDRVFVTHGDADHINGIRCLLEGSPGTKIAIGGLVMPKAGEGEECYTKLAALAEKRKIEVFFAEKGDSFEGCLGKAQLSCLYPDKDQVCQSRNDESLVLHVTYGNFRLLLTGDLETAGENVLLADGSLNPVTILKAGHHGSQTSSGEAFVQALRPAHVILSYGKGNRYGHPAPEVRERFEKAGAVLWETAAKGAVLVWTDGRRIRIRGFVPQETRGREL